jgi:hypothetical protein
MASIRSGFTCWHARSSMKAERLRSRDSGRSANAKRHVEVRRHITIFANTARWVGSSISQQRTLRHGSRRRSVRVWARRSRPGIEHQLGLTASRQQKGRSRPHPGPCNSLVRPRVATSAEGLHQRIEHDLERVVVTHDRWHRASHAKQLIDRHSCRLRA